MGNFKLLAIYIAVLLLVGCQSTEQNLNSKMPDELLGVVLQYTYSEGNEYKLKFEEHGISYQFRSGSKPDKWWGEFEYNHILTEGNEHLVSWHEPGYNDYVTLLINFDKQILYGSGILGGKTVHFQKAKITKISTNKNVKFYKKEK